MSAQYASAIKIGEEVIGTDRILQDEKKKSVFAKCWACPMKTP